MGVLVSRASPLPLLARETMGVCTCPADLHVHTSGHELAVFCVEHGEGRGVMLCKGLHEFRVGRLNVIDESCEGERPLSAS